MILSFLILKYVNYSNLIFLITYSANSFAPFLSLGLLLPLALLMDSSSASGVRTGRNGAFIVKFIYFLFRSKVGEHMNMDAVSVVIPTMNRLDMLKKVLASIEKQSVQPEEIVIVDGGSTDGTVEYVTSLRGNVIYLRQDGKYPSNARNCGILRSRGNIIAFPDDGAIPSSNWLEETIRTYHINSKIGGLGGLIRSWMNTERISDRLLRLIEGRAYSDFPMILSQISKNILK